MLNMDVDDAPSFLRRSKSKPLRARQPTASEDLSNVGNSEVSPSEVATSLRNKQKARTKPKARLSFAGDDDESAGESFQVKKSHLSRQVKLGSTASSVGLSSNLDQLSITRDNAAPAYNKEYLSELKASTPSTPPTRNAETQNDTNLPVGDGELLGAMVIDEAPVIDVATEIPSESSILAAKQKRERLRGSAGTDDDGFISLSVTRHQAENQGPHPESRLVREEDELGEGDDEFAEYTSAQERIALGKKSRKQEAESRKASMRVMIADVDEEDEESREWEKEQLRRGSRKDNGSEASALTKQEYRPVPIPPTVALPSLDAAITRLTHSMTELTASHAANTAAMSTLADELTILEDKDKEMRRMVETAEAKRSWFTAFREWVETVAAFLDEKYPILEKLEDEHHSLLKEKMDMTTQRRLQDDKDDMSLFLGPLPSLTEAKEEELDELGRVVPEQNSAVARRQRMQSRIARRARRPRVQDEDGYSTDGSLPPSEDADFRTAISKLSDKTDDVLGDVRSNEFKNPTLGIAKWFGGWRDKYSDTYTGAFGGLGLVSAWEFWVRLEMLMWDPTMDPRVLDSFAWYSALFEYSRPRSTEAMDDDVERDLGPDGDLVSAMISTAVVPSLCKFIRGGGFDPYSRKHVLLLVDLAEQVEASATRDKFELLLKSVVDTFQQVVESAENALQPYLTLQRTIFDPEAIPARRRFLMRQLKLISNILRWRKYTGERFGIGELVRRGVTKLMRPVADSGWEVGGQEIMRKVATMMPPELQLNTDIMQSKSSRV